MRVNSANSSLQAAQLGVFRARQSGEPTIGKRPGVGEGAARFEIQSRNHVHAAKTANAQAPLNAAQSTPIPLPADQAATTGGAALDRPRDYSTLRAPALYGQQHLDAIKAAWGKKTGEDGFNQAADADGSGVVDFKDTTFVLANWGGKAPTVPAESAGSLPETYGTKNIDAALKAFGATKGDDRYSQSADADGNGVVDFKDVTFVQANWGRVIATG